MISRLRRATMRDVPALVELACVTFPLACPPELGEDAIAAFIATHLDEARFRDYVAHDAILVFDECDGGADAPGRGVGRGGDRGGERRRNETANVALSDGSARGRGGLQGYALVQWGGRAPQYEYDSGLPLAAPAYLSKLYVHESRLSRGLGARLMDGVVGFVSGLGADGVWLNTNVGNARARRFYERQGFAVVGERGFPIGGGIMRDVVYARRT